MFIIFGTRTNPRVEGAFNHKCPNCGKTAVHTLARITRWFTLFFIPIIPFSNKLLVGCNTCGLRQELSGEAKERMEDLIEQRKQIAQA